MHSLTKRSVRVLQTDPVEPGNNSDSNKFQGDNTVPSHECFFLRDICLTGGNFPDPKKVLAVVNHRIDRIPFIAPFFAGSYIHQYGHTAG
jgi:hypothetical protein